MRNGESCPVRAQGGFTYMVVLALCVIIGLMLARAGELWQTAARRENERELLFIGGQFRDAIRRYYENSPGTGRYPRALSDLLLDKRFPNVRRYLRRIYVDPMTGTPDWGLVTGPEGIRGVYSKSTLKPFKTAGFDSDDSAFENAASYADWKFVHQAAPQPGAAGAPGAGVKSPPASGAVTTPTAPGVSLPPVVTAPPPPPPPPPPAPPPEQPRNEPCESERTADFQTCFSLQDRGASVAEIGACNTSAVRRYSACLAGRSPPALKVPPEN